MAGGPRKTGLRYSKDAEEAANCKSAVEQAPSNFRFGVRLGGRKGPVDLHSLPLPSRPNRTITAGRRVRRLQTATWRGTLTDGPSLRVSGTSRDICIPVKVPPCWANDVREKIEEFDVS